MTTKTKPIHLYWCTTADHDEDWFVFAPSAREARKFHEDEEGYDRGYAECVLVRARVPNIDRTGWPKEEELEALGAKFLCDGPGKPRVVEIDGKTYAEGLLESVLVQLHDDEFERRGEGRPNGTARASAAN